MPGAARLRALYAEISPLIEEYTSSVCPECATVCCRQRHGIPDERDLRFFSCLEAAPLPYAQELQPDGPCQFMGEKGCILERWQRPFRCTWYFCDSLLAAMDAGSQRRARGLVSMLGELVTLRLEILETCGHNR